MNRILSFVWLQYCMLMINMFTEFVIQNYITERQVISIGSVKVIGIWINKMQVKVTKEMICMENNPRSW